ncbi:carboxylesteras-like protein [Boeremia exigua]|uniref:carboxylesterase-like protein n=1 Tax=Boeremia exigua TaxID=749465 RepID=UPI001E8D060D|nr:carboxylesterase-like protein [Boeremia exigua]KAH6639880.1 carboxylesteras-like protein [Boeremia exigua]
MRTLSTITILLWASYGGHAASGASFETVKTENGPIVGHRSSGAEAVWEYLGIPYAQPPLGDLRFAAPQKYKANGSYVAESFGFDCPSQPAVQPAFPGFTTQARRILAYFTGAAGTQRSEDCLTLNIWAKPTTKSYKADKPVFVLFHGGRFAGGNTNTPFANGKYLADGEDLIVISANYRLNVFGFPGAPGAGTNLGLRDQRLAVEWIQKNIKSFGGNPKKIVIGGQSSGGVAVDWWSYAYKQNPIVHGLVSTSGNAFSFPLNTPQKQVSNWYSLSASLGCGNSSSSDTISCMRGLPFETISAAASKIAPSPGGSPVRSTPPFYPTVDNQTLLTDYLSLSASGSFAKLPYFHGYNNFEQGYYVIPAFAQGRNVTEAQGAQLLLESFVCPTSFEAQQRANAKVPTWVYRYFGDWDNTRLYPTSGAYHGTELHMILGGSEDASGLPQTQAQKDTVKIFQRALAAFVEDPKNGLSKLGWPSFHPHTNSVVEIAVGNQPNVTFAKPEQYDGLCANVTLGAFQ